MSIKYCVQCGEECAENAEYCPECGHPNFAPEFMQYCAACDTACELLTKRCPECNCREFYYDLEAHKNELKEEERRKIEEENKEVFDIQDGVLVGYKGKNWLVKIPDGVVAIGEKVFEKNDNIGRVVLPDSVKRIETSAFSKCEGLSTVIFSQSLECIGECAFYGSGLNEAILPNSLKIIEAGAFKSCIILNKVQLSKNLKSIGRNAFSGCWDLKNIVIPKSVETISEGAFAGCGGLSKDGVTIYAEAKSKPRGWCEKRGFLGIGYAKDWFGRPMRWNPGDIPVVWGYKDE